MWSRWGGDGALEWALGWQLLTQLSGPLLNTSQIAATPPWCSGSCFQGHISSFGLRDGSYPDRAWAGESPASEGGKGTGWKTATSPGPADRIRRARLLQRQLSEAEEKHPELSSNASLVWKGHSGLLPSRGYDLTTSKFFGGNKNYSCNKKEEQK